MCLSLCFQDVWDIVYWLGLLLAISEKEQSKQIER